MSLREWLILIGILIIIGVLADGYRRMRLARKRSSEISFGLEEVKGYGDDFSSELPNGGARPSLLKEGFVRKDPVRTRVEPGFSGGGDYGEDELTTYQENVSQRQQPLKATIAGTEDMEDASSGETVAEERSRNQRVLDLDEPVPILMNQEELSQPVSVGGESCEGGFARADRPVRMREASKLQTGPEELVSRPVSVSSQGKAPIQEREVSARGAGNPQKELNLGGSQREKTEKLKDRPPAREVIVMNVLAKGGGIFTGDQLMQSMLASGMHFGDMSIFHRYSHPDGTGKILFSMANGVKPGTFIIDHLETTETPALSLFMSLPGPDKPMQAFALMEETARRLALDLGGELKDEQFSVMTQQTLEHCRQRIREYERKQLARQPVH